MNGRPISARVRRSGFTLIEVMLVVAIIGVLVAVAIPTFLRFHYRAKASEGMTNLKAIHIAEEAYMSEAGTYVATTPVPGTLPGSTPVSWPSGSSFDILGWEPEGKVFYQYLVSADNLAGGPGSTRYTAEAAADIDANGTLSFWALVKPLPGAASGIAGMLPGSTCVVTGVYNPATMASDVLDTVGPCDGVAGRAEF